MSPATLTPAAAPPRGPQPHRWTIAEYRQLGRAGLFRDCRTLLIDGEIVTMPLPDPPHDEALNLTQDALRVAFAAGHHVRNQQALDIGARTDPGPDLAVVAGTIRDQSGRTPTTAVLVVEVADSSLFLDTTTKAEWYATAGVPEYWVLDVAGRRLLVYRDPEPLPGGLGATAYRTHLTLTPADTVAPLAAPHATIPVADLLP